MGRSTNSWKINVVICAKDEEEEYSSHSVSVNVQPHLTRKSCELIFWGILFDNDWTKDSKWAYNYTYLNERNEIVYRGEA